MSDLHKVLVVEDEQDLREALVESLKDESLEVFAATNGDEGVKIALAEKPDLILLDLRMPIMDGNAVLQSLRADEWGKSVMVIVLTAQSDIQSMSDAVEYGGMRLEYLVKTDWTLEDIVTKVKEKIAAHKADPQIPEA